MQKVVIRHLGIERDEHQFCVVTNTRTIPKLQVLSPSATYLGGSQRVTLKRELQWYLESFLRYPYSPEIERAERLLSAQRAWGCAAFDALFRAAGDDAYGEVWSRPDLVRVEVEAASSEILSWPWELLCDGDAGTPVALRGSIVRRLTGAGDLASNLEGFPRDRIRILLVISRPYAKDIAYRSVAMSLIQQVYAKRLPVDVTVLRPPTLTQLREVLARSPDTFHIVHFDGHGSHRAKPGKTSRPLAYLIFEDGQGNPDPIDAGELGRLIREHHVPLVVLNACQSGMLSSDTRGLFASVATSMMQAGACVVAMAYSLHVTGAQLFVESFYQSLFDTGSVELAVRSGRNAMAESPGRHCARGAYPLSDWVVPVLYQGAPLSFSFLVHMKWEPSPPELRFLNADMPSSSLLIGRDAMLLELERAMRSEASAILIHGLGGIGKTTLVRGFAKWLAQTGGLDGDVLWVDFRNARSAESIINEMFRAIVTTRSPPPSVTAAAEILRAALADAAALVVWDNFESVRGAEALGLPGEMTNEDQTTLLDFIKSLSGGRSKVILTSRSPESWLGPACLRVRALSGLRDWELWDFLDHTIQSSGIEIDLSSPSIVTLMNRLGGHPLLIKTILPQFLSMSTSEVLSALEHELARLGTADDEASPSERATAVFQLFEGAMPQETMELLEVLSLHEQFFDATLLGMILNAPEPDRWAQADITDVLQGLNFTGLLAPLQNATAVYELHPMFSTYLGRRFPTAGDKWAESFVAQLGYIADEIARMPVHTVEIIYVVHGANFRRALASALDLGMAKFAFAISQSLVHHARATQSWSEAEALLENEFMDSARSIGESAVATCYYNLGCVAYAKNEFERAREMATEAAKINARLGNEDKLMDCRHLLSMVASDSRDFDAAKQLIEGSGFETREASRQAFAHAQMGRVAEKRGDYEEAKGWYLKALFMDEELGDQEGQAFHCHQLGIAEQELGDYASSLSWYLRALSLFSELKNDYRVALVYHELGRLAQNMKDLDAAERYYHGALAIQERVGDDLGAARLYNQLGTIWLLRKDTEAAERWYMKALDLKKKIGLEHELASTYHQLGCLAAEKNDPDAAERMFWEALRIFRAVGDEVGAKKSVMGLMYLRASGKG